MGATLHSLFAHAKSTGLNLPSIFASGFAITLSVLQPEHLNINFSQARYFTAFD